MPPAKALSEGKTAPDFTLPDQSGRKVRLRDFQGKKVILYFYVRDNTPGCTREACNFRDGFRALKKADAIVLGISPDPVQSHMKFADKFKLPFPILSDAGAKVAKKYGVWARKTLYGRKFWGVVRSTFIVDKNGKIAKIFRNVKVDKHLDQVMAMLNARKSTVQM